MILLKILENDLHRARDGKEASPLMVEVPAKKSFIPAVISNTSGKFLISRKLTSESMIRVGVFPHDPDKLDDILDPMFRAAMELSIVERWSNVFTGSDSPADDAHSYVSANSGMKSQPHVCLIPRDWETDRIAEWLKINISKSTRSIKYKDHCRIVLTKVSFPVFCSRPDMVGMYTHFIGGQSSIILHNVKRGLSFCPSC